MIKLVFPRIDQEKLRTGIATPDPIYPIYKEHTRYWLRAVELKRTGYSERQSQLLPSSPITEGGIHA